MRDKAFNIAKNLKYDGCQCGLASVVYKCFDKKKRHLRKVHSSFKDNIWGADVADMQLITKFDKGICFLLCVIDIFSKYQ